MSASRKVLELMLSVILILRFKSTSAVQQFYKISASTGGNENAVCPQDTLIYYCNIVPSTAKGTTVWAIYMANSSIDSGEILELMQAEFLGCAHETVTVIDKAGFFIAMNGDSSGRICVNSNLTVIANMSLNGKRVSCVNVGGAYLNVEGSTNIYVAGTPTVTIVPTLNQLLINIKSVPPQATNLTYSINVLQGNISISNNTVTNRSEFLLTNLIPNTAYTITVRLENCPNVSTVEISKCTLAFAPSIDVSYDQSGIPNLLTWADTGGCVQGYQVQLTTDTRSSFHYDVSRNECSHNCSIPVILPGPFDYYILSASSITYGILGPLNTRFLNGTHSTNLRRTYPLDIATPVCPNMSYNYSCSNTDTIPGITVWKFPSGTCPCQSDSIYLTRNAADNCNSVSGTCGNFMAFNNEPIDGYCLTSVLIAEVGSNHDGFTVQCLAEYDNITQFEGVATISVVSPPTYIGASVQRNLTELLVALNVVDENTNYTIGIVNISRNESGTPAMFHNLSPNTRYVINILASNCAGERTYSTTACTLAMPPADVRSDFLQGENDMYVIYWTHVGGCVTKYRVRITTDDGSIVVDDNNVMSSSYLLQINETANQTTYRIQVYSITEDAVESAIGSGNTLPIKGSTATFELLWVGIAIEPLLAFVLAFLLGLCIGLKKRVPKEATNRQPPGSGMNPQRAERTEAAAQSNQSIQVEEKKKQLTDTLLNPAL